MILMITLTGLGVPTSVQLADKNKTGYNPIQSLIFVKSPMYV